ncbi:MAG TPA: YdjY domain-containing protein [Verrucomicrobiota bacterium]|nr:YdjY domain-containing protein [Verrucomicrobiota bacterium]HRZ56130.1 YdjY domain-containing protein [Candidatus Paceibacterota bacterium]
MTAPSASPGRRRPGSGPRGIFLALVLGALAPHAASAPGDAIAFQAPFRRRDASSPAKIGDKMSPLLWFTVSMRTPGLHTNTVQELRPIHDSWAQDVPGKGILSLDAPEARSGDFGSGIHRIGLVTLDRTARTVRFPAAVNQRAGLIEYAVVTTTGKVHESIFRTEAAPRDIHLAMLLLGVKPANTNVLHDDPHSPLPGERIGIEVGWQRGRKEVRRPLADFVRIESPARSSGSRGWLYNGSFLVNGDFAAQRGGSIVSLITDASALVNNPWPDRGDDEIHQVRGKALPREDSPVEIILRVLGQ